MSLSLVPDVLQSFEQFVALAKELAKLKELATPQYRAATRDLYLVSQKLLQANETLSRWLWRYRYFDFSTPDARARFTQLAQDFGAMKSGAEIQQLRFSCHDIRTIYQRDIKSKLVKWLPDRHKLEAAQAVFDQLSDADGAMVRSIDTEILPPLSRLSTQLEQAVSSGDLDRAEALRLAYRSNSAPMVERMEKFGAELATLVVDFAQMSGTTLTVPTSRGA